MNIQLQCITPMEDFWEAVHFRVSHYSYLTSKLRSTADLKPHKNQKCLTTTNSELSSLTQMPKYGFDSLSSDIQL